jgi:hypothetical protein
VQPGFEAITLCISAIVPYRPYTVAVARKMGPRRSERALVPSSQRKLGAPRAPRRRTPALSQSQAQATAAAGLLALNQSAGIRRTRSPRLPPTRRRGSSTTASADEPAVFNNDDDDNVDDEANPG